MPNKQGLPNFQAGETLKAADLNRIVDAIIRKVVGGNGIAVSLINGQLVISQVSNFETSLGLRKMSIRTNRADYLTCRTLDAQGVIGDVDIAVMKPWTLGRTPFDGNLVNGASYAYSSNFLRVSNGTETQRITQDYFVGAVIYVGTTEITEEPVTGVFSNSIDMNIDGRQWCKPEVV